MMGADEQQFVVLRIFGAAEDGEGAELHRALQRRRIEPPGVAGPPAPGERRRPPVFGADPLRPDRARGPAGLVPPRLELLGSLEVRPASLQRELARRVPREAQRRRVERPRLDVPAMLIRL